MKIKKIKINSYGKLKEKEINLEDGINIISGKNEAGKSTLLKFIVNSFYGISKNKKGKEYSDFEKYTPWVGEEFSGKIEYELDNKNKYEVYRDFKKKNPKIFNDKMEDISKNFNIDKTNGNEFFYEQTKVDEQLFTSTVVVGQQEVKLGKQEQNILIQKIANLVGTGDDNVSYKRAIDRINRRQLDEIGTSKSREKPINIIARNIQKLEEEKDELEKFKYYKYDIEENRNKLREEIESLENENDILKKIKKLQEETKLENEKINVKENIKNENEEKINLVKNKINEIKNENNYEKINNKNKLNKNTEKIKKKLNKKLLITFIFLILINIIQFIFIKNNIIKYIFLLTVPTFLIFAIFYKNKKIKIQKNIEKNKLEEINNKINNLNNEINLLENNNKNIKKEIDNLRNSLILKINFEKEKIKNNYLKKIEENKINNFLQLENPNYELENLQNKLNDKKIELHSLELDKKNIEPQLENLSKIEEELVNDKEKMSTLQQLNSSFELTKEILEQAYNEMKNTVTPKFTEQLSKNISKITNGKYCNLLFNDEEGLIVELENGNYVTASKLSVGTIDQLYLSLRLSMVEELSEEKMPIILDEVFAYYDTERLTNILKYINEEFKNHQVIIFTCTNREKEILEKLEIKYNICELEEQKRTLLTFYIKKNSPSRGSLFNGNRDA